MRAAAVPQIQLNGWMVDILVVSQTQVHSKEMEIHSERKYMQKVGEKTTDL